MDGDRYRRAYIKRNTKRDTWSKEINIYGRQHTKKGTHTRKDKHNKGYIQKKTYKGK